MIVQGLTKKELDGKPMKILLQEAEAVELTSLRRYLRGRMRGRKAKEKVEENAKPKAKEKSAFD